jgi:hypothetical protein
VQLLNARIYSPQRQLDELLAFMATVPDLHDAACRRHLDIFDLALDKRVAGATHIAQGICAACPVLTECRQWARTAPAGRSVTGVIAGQVRRAPRIRPPSDRRR